MPSRSNVESIVKIADDWLESNRVSESWRIIDMLRNQLVREVDKNGILEAALAPLYEYVDHEKCYTRDQAVSTVTRLVMRDLRAAS